MVSQVPPKHLSWVRFLLLTPIIFLIGCSSVPQEISKVNSLVNSQVTYVSDKGDYWQTPEETLRLRTGDCEDYVILKRSLLIYPSRILVVYPRGDSRSIQHAILEVFFSDTSVYLDNLYDYPLTRDQFTERYRVFYTFPYHVTYKKDLQR